MAINFPNSPSVNDIHSEGGIRWKWNGSSWTRASGAAVTDTITTANDNSTTTLYPVMTSGTGGQTAKIATTATKNISFDASDGNLTVGGNISAGGTITYEDVRNVDSIGIVTARTGIHIDDSITHIGDTNTKIRFPAADIITAETGGSERFRINSDRVIIGQALSNNQPTYDASTTLVTSSTNNAAAWNAIAIISGHTSGASFLKFGDKDDEDASSIGHYNADNSLRFSTGGANERLRIDSTGDVRFAGTNLTDSTNKNVNLTAPSYDTDEEDVNLVQVENEAASNQISFGGGTSGLNAATTLRFLTASAVNTVTGTERLRINSSGQVSIGNNPTVASDAALHIELDGTKEYLRLEGDGGTSNAYLEIEAPNNRRKAIIFKSGGTRRGIIGVGDSDESSATSLFFSASTNVGGDSPHMVIDSSGKVGIGEGTPTSLLHLKGSAPRITLMDTGGSNDYAKIFSTGGALYFQQRDDSAHGNIVFRTENNSTAIERLRIDSAGIIWANKANPVSSSLMILDKDGSGEAQIRFYNAGSNTAQIALDSSEELTFDVNGGERLRITSAGKVGINEQSPQQQLHVHSDTAYEGILINGNAAPSVCFAANTGTTSEWKVGIPGQNNTYFGISTGNGNTNRLLMDANGKTCLSGLPDTEVLTVNGAQRWKYESSNWNTGSEGAFIDYYASGSMVRLGHVNGASGSAKHIVFYSGGTERLRITSTGLITNKGTWTNTYAYNDTTQCGYQAQNLSDTTNTYAALRLTAGSSSPATAQIASVRTGTGQNDLTFQLETGNTAFEALRITSGGNIRIPFIGNGTGLRQKIQFVTEANYFDEVAYIAMNRTAVSSAPSDMIFATGSVGSVAERLRITSDGKIGVGIASPMSRFQCGSHTFSGGNGMYTNSRVGMSNHGSLTGLMLASTYNDPTHPEYGLVFIQGPNTSSYNVWSISPDGPAKGNSLNLHYGAQNTNIHTYQNRKFEFTGEGYLRKSNHPAFRAGLDANTSFANGAAVVFTDVSSDAGHFNRSGSYGTSTGKFTAPVAGIYEFTVSAIIMSLSDGVDMTDCFHLMYQPSGGTGIRIAYSNRRGEYINGETGNAGYYTDFLVGCMVNMAANSTVWVENKKRTHTWHGNSDYCWFTGKLIA